MGEDGLSVHKQKASKGFTFPISIKDLVKYLNCNFSTINFKNYHSSYVLFYIYYNNGMFDINCNTILSKYKKTIHNIFKRNILNDVKEWMNSCNGENKNIYVKFRPLWNEIILESEDQMIKRYSCQIN